METAAPVDSAGGLGRLAGVLGGPVFGLSELALNELGRAAVRLPGGSSLRRRKLQDGPQAASSRRRRPALFSRPADGIAEVEFRGVVSRYPSADDDALGLASLEELQFRLEAAVSDPGIDAVLLAMDSPGGVVAGVAELSKVLRKLRAEKSIYAFCDGGTATSAAVYIAGSCTQVFCTEAAMVGALGLFAVVVDESEAAAQAGRKVHVVRSAGAAMKGAGVPGSVVDDAMLADAQRVVDDVAEVLTTAFSEGRRIPLARARAMSDGRVHVGRKARAAGFVDDVLTRDELLERIASAHAERRAAREERRRAQAAADAEAQAASEAERKQQSELAAKWSRRRAFGCQG